MSNNGNDDNEISEAASSSSLGMEAAAKMILNRAVEMDQSRRKLEALACYREGIDLLMSVLRGFPAESPNKAKMKGRIEEYITRAERLKVQIESEKRSGSLREQIRIDDGSIGFGYEKVFGALIDDDLTRVDIDDPYIRLPHQVEKHFRDDTKQMMCNFVRFCEMLVKRGRKLRHINLVTGRPDVLNKDQIEYQKRILCNEIKNNLAMKSVALRVTLSDSLHDREIRFDNGWIVKIGRGLDYFKNSAKFALGNFDMDLRPCHETTIDIFHKNSLV